MCDDLKDYKVCLINDRKDLEKQLGVTAAIDGREGDLHHQFRGLEGEAGDGHVQPEHGDGPQVSRSMPNRDLPDYLESVLNVPVYESFGLVNPSERILLMIDEAHRTQSGDLGDNLFEAFPNATRLAFTGTPLIVVKDRKTTPERFGQYIDKYKLQDAVDDGATVQILYEGKTASTAVKDKTQVRRRRWINWPSSMSSTRCGRPRTSKPCGGSPSGKTASSMTW